MIFLDLRFRFGHQIRLVIQLIDLDRFTRRKFFLLIQLHRCVERGTCRSDRLLFSITRRRRSCREFLLLLDRRNTYDYGSEIVFGSASVANLFETIANAGRISISKQSAYLRVVNMSCNAVGAK